MADVSCRIWIDPPGTGAWNMAVDEWLLRWAAETRRPAIRFYQWVEPTLSLGYFQCWQARVEHRASLGCPLVRRPSGGGAIVHDREWTYSVVVPQAAWRGREPAALYNIFHQTLVELLKSWGLESRLWACGQQGRGCGAVGNESPPQEASSEKPEPFLCFQRRNRWDVVARKPAPMFEPGPGVMRLKKENAPGAEVKLAGSAQRRSSTAVLQHGSILLARSPAAPELDGLAELLNRSVPPEEILEAWLVLLRERLGWRWTEGLLTPAEQAEAQELVRSKYGNECWTLRR